MFRTKTTLHNSFADGELETVCVELPRLWYIAFQPSPFSFYHRKVELRELRQSETEFEFIEKQGEVGLEIREVVRLDEDESKKDSDCLTKVKLVYAP